MVPSALGKSPCPADSRARASRCAEVGIRRRVRPHLRIPEAHASGSIISMLAVVPASIRGGVSVSISLCEPGKPQARERVGNAVVKILRLAPLWGFNTAGSGNANGCWLHQPSRVRDRGGSRRGSAVRVPRPARRHTQGRACGPGPRFRRQRDEQASASSCESPPRHAHEVGQTAPCFHCRSSGGVGDRRRARPGRAADYVGAERWRARCPGIQSANHLARDHGSDSGCRSIRHPRAGTGGDWVSDPVRYDDSRIPVDAACGPHAVV